MQYFNIGDDGVWSNVFMVAFVLFFLAVIGFCVAKMAGAVRSIKARGEERRAWGGVVGSLLGLLAMVSIGVAGGVAGAEAGDKTTSIAEQAGAHGFVMGAAASSKESPVKWIAVGLFAIAVVVPVFVSSVLFEPPVRIGVSARGVELVYRLPWRDRWIGMGDITGVELERHVHREGSGDWGHSYTLMIRERGRVTKLQQADSDPRHREALKAANDAIWARWRRPVVVGK